MPGTETRKVTPAKECKIDVAEIMLTWTADRAKRTDKINTRVN